MGCTGPGLRYDARPSEARRRHRNAGGRLSVEITVGPDLIRVIFAGMLTGKDLVHAASRADEIERDLDPPPSPAGSALSPPTAG